MSFWKKLFGTPQSPQSSPKKLATPQRARIFSVVHSGDVASLEQCLREGDDVNVTDKNGGTPLHDAASAPDAEMCIALLSKGANVNAKTKLDSTPLDIAATMFLTLLDGPIPDQGKPYLKVCVILFEHGARPSSDPRFARINKILSSLPQKTMKYEELTFEALVEELVSVSQLGFDWGLKNGFPAVKDYPQYSQVRKLGELIHAKAGLEGMQKACHILRLRVVTREGGGQYLAEHSWDGIAGWRP